MISIHSLLIAYQLGSPTCPELPSISVFDSSLLRILACTPSWTHSGITQTLGYFFFAKKLGLESAYQPYDLIICFLHLIPLHFFSTFELLFMTTISFEDSVFSITPLQLLAGSFFSVFQFYLFGWFKETFFRMGHHCCLIVRKMPSW